MCSHCSGSDPRDRIGTAERALLGLRTLLNELAPNSDIQADCIGPLVSLIHDTLGSAAEEIQHYVPRDSHLAQA